ncbi:MAG TPA: LLM class flavin-dependent oxidoreductase [Conexibacter sp.]|jgi:alkanesulfonate monooxygenase SsuD/methylene tetrahydromethanopterin reductase-like flavin-dependent oxidoreductase (luciferase family)
MIEVGIFTTGGADVPFETSRSGIRIPAASIEEINAAAQRVTNGQIRQGVIADRMGFDYFWMSEHHFIFEGSELSPNPIQSQTAIAALTKRIRLAQAANILTWWHPLRLAEQLAILDTISGGRLDVGLGRGYQPRETETFGYSYGSSHGDQERNRAYFEEAIDLIRKAWTEPSFSFHGDFFSVPTKYTPWGHPVTAAYWDAHGGNERVNEVMGPADGDISIDPMRMDPNGLMRQISLLPRPVQQPHPPLWQLMVSPRSLDNAARNGFNGYSNLVPNGALRKQIDSYIASCERFGWPDARGDGDAFKPGWDSARHRGLITGRWIHVDEPGVGNAKKFRAGLEAVWDWYHPFGFSALVTGDPTVPATTDLLEQGDLALVGSKDRVIEGIMRIKEEVYGDSDFFFNCQFEAPGLTSSENEEQIQYFAEEILPVLRRECGGGPDLPQTTVDLIPEVVAAVEAAAAS